MSECNKCNGTLFVCENHPDQEAHQCKHCGGAGMPCECTKLVIQLDENIINLDEEGKKGIFFYDSPNGGFYANIDVVKYLVKNHSNLYYKRLQELNLTNNDEIWNL